MVIAYLIGYLIVLTLSSFAHSGRFHHPIIPIEMIFAALGMKLISNKRQASVFDLFLVFEREESLDFHGRLVGDDVINLAVELLEAFRALNHLIAARELIL